METAHILFAVLTSLLGFVLGIVNGRKLERKEPVGTLKIDRSLYPEEGPYMFLELTEDVEHVSKLKTVLLEVENTSYLSRD